MKRVSALLLLADGELRGRAALKRLARRFPVLCADGGARHAAALGARPRWVLGDFDSVPPRLRRGWKGTTFLHVPDQDSNDLEKALRFARRLGVKTVYAACLRGGGLDHELVNFAVLEAARGFELVVVDGGEARLLGPGLYRPALKKGARFTLLAAPRGRVTLSGAAYGLRRETLRRGARGLGNRAVGRVRLRVHDGRVWLLS